MESSLTNDAKDWYVADFGGVEVPTGGGDDNDKSNGKNSPRKCHSSFRDRDFNSKTNMESKTNLYRFITTPPPPLLGSP